MMMIMQIKVIVGLQTWWFPWWNLKLVPYTDGKEKLKKWTVYPRLVGDGFNKWSNVLMRLVLDNSRTSRSPHLPTRILKVYRETLTAFSPIHHPDGLNCTLLSQGCLLENDTHCGNSEQYVFQRQRREWGASSGPGAAQGSMGGHIPLMTSSNNNNRSIYIVFAECQTPS